MSYCSQISRVWLGMRFRFGGFWAVIVLGLLVLYASRLDLFGSLDSAPRLIGRLFRAKVGLRVVPDSRRLIF